MSYYSKSGAMWKRVRKYLTILESYPTQELHKKLFGITGATSRQIIRVESSLIPFNFLCWQLLTLFCSLFSVSFLDRWFFWSPFLNFLSIVSINYHSLHFLLGCTFSWTNMFADGWNSTANADAEANQSRSAATGVSAPILCHLQSTWSLLNCRRSNCNRINLLSMLFVFGILYGKQLAGSTLFCLLFFKFWASDLSYSCLRDLIARIQNCQYRVLFLQQRVLQRFWLYLYFVAFWQFCRVGPTFITVLRRQGSFR